MTGVLQLVSKISFVEKYKRYKMCIKQKYTTVTPEYQVNMHFLKIFPKSFKKLYALQLH